MTAYLLTPEVHEHLVDAVEIGDITAAFAMLKAMKPVNPSAWLACDKEGNVGCSTKENHALRCCEAGTKAEPLYTLGDTA